MFKTLLRMKSILLKEVKVRNRSDEFNIWKQYFHGGEDSGLSLVEAEGYS
jgi:hypothetical protein